MAYVRLKKRGSRNYYYLVECSRRGKKVQQTCLRYLGTEKPSQQEVEKVVNEIKSKNRGD